MSFRDKYNFFPEYYKMQDFFETSTQSPEKFTNRIDHLTSKIFARNVQYLQTGQK